MGQFKIKNVQVAVLVVGLAAGFAILVSSSLQAADCGETCTTAHKDWPSDCGDGHVEPSAVSKKYF